MENKKVTFTDEQKEEIKKIFSSGTDLSYGDVGKMYGVCRKKIHYIVNAERYKKMKVSSSKEKEIEFPILPRESFRDKRKNITGVDADVSHIEGARDKVRELVRIRDNRTCQKCFRKWIEGNRRFDVHHLDENMDGRSHEKGIHKYDIHNMDKLITLCHKCHFSLDITRRKIAQRSRKYSISTISG